MTEDLSDDERTMLDIERQWWQYPGAKDQAIRDRLDMSSTRYYQALNVLIDTQRAMAHDPMTVRKLQRQRAARQRSQSLRAARS